jgi:hypothetical protein
MIKIRFVGKQAKKKVIKVIKGKSNPQITKKG